MNNTDLQTANRGARAVLATVMWEFFSYYGMRALLILYLTESLHDSDVKAYNIFGAYTALIFLTPIIGGYLADKMMGFKRAVVIGCLLIIIGHATLSLPGIINFYIGLSFLVIGVGFFKTNAICLVADCYKHYPERQDSAMTWYYVAANVGGTLGPLVCATVAHYAGWHLGFATAGIGMALGLTLLLWQRGYLNNAGSKPGNNSLKTYLWVALGTAMAMFIVLFSIKNNWAGYILAATGFAALPFIIQLYRHCDKRQRRGLIQALMLTLLGTAFWAFDQQGGSSISLFILRDIQRHIGSFTVPTAWFQSINPLIIMLTGPCVAIVWRLLAENNIRIKAAFKVLFGLLALTLGFTLLYSGAKIASLDNLTSMLWPLLGLSLIGMAELFIDPVILSELNRCTPKRSRGFVTGLYYLFVGAYANYAAAQIAKLSVFASHASTASATGFSNEFGLIAIAGLGFIACAFLLTKLSR